MSNACITFAKGIYVELMVVYRDMIRFAVANIVLVVHVVQTSYHGCYPISVSFILIVP